MSDRVKTIAVDFDGVIHAYSRGWADGTIYDDPIPGALDGLHTLMATHAVFIHTSRNPRQVATWLAEHCFEACVEGPVHAPMEFWNEQGRLLVTNRKLPAVAYIDDRGVRFTSWPQILRDLDTGGQGTAQAKHAEDLKEQGRAELREQLHALRAKWNTRRAEREAHRETADGPTARLASIEHDIYNRVIRELDTVLNETEARRG